MQFRREFVLLCQAHPNEGHHRQTQDQKRIEQETLDKGGVHKSSKKISVKVATSGHYPVAESRLVVATHSYSGTAETVVSAAELLSDHGALGMSIGTFRRYSAYDRPCTSTRSRSSNWMATRM